MTGITPQVADWGRAEDATGAPPDRSSQGSATSSAEPVLPHVRLGRLARAIDTEVIPRLLLAHRCGLEPSPAEALSEDAEAVMSLLRDERLSAAAAHLERLQNAGRTVEAIYLDILAPVARHLGAMWAADRCGFVDVTLGVLGLQQLMRSFPLDPGEEHAPGPANRRVLLAAMPGEQHTFGVSMLSEFFRRDGWDVLDEPQESIARLVECVRGQWIGVVGLSLSCDSHLETLARAIGQIRRHSLNRVVGIMVGGPAFAGHPERIARVAADASAQDPRQAVRQARDLLQLLPASR